MRRDIYGEYFEDCMEDSRFVDLDGNSVKRTPFSNPYNFDDYVEWKSSEFSKDDCAVYSDRLSQWDNEKYNYCFNEVFKKNEQKFNSDNPSGIEKFLSMYFEKNVKLTAILRGCNCSNGFPYLIFYYKEN